MERMKNLIFVLFLIVIGLVAFMVKVLIDKWEHDTFIEPKNDNVTIIKKFEHKNSEIKDSINILENKKNEEVQNVKTLNNDSTYKLFKQLTSK